MLIDGVSFNKDHFAKMSEEEFLKEFEGKGYKHIYEGPDREAQLKTAYQNLTKKASRKHTEDESEEENELLPGEVRATVTE